MRYWVYINNGIKGPFEKAELNSVEGFTQETLICPETPPDGKTQEWQPASAVLAAEAAAPAQTAPVQTPQQEQPPAQQPDAAIKIADNAADGISLSASSGSPSGGIGSCGPMTMENAADILGPGMTPSPGPSQTGRSSTGRQTAISLQMASSLSPAGGDDIKLRLDQFDKNISNLVQMLETTQRQMLATSRSAPAGGGQPLPDDLTGKLDHISAELASLKTTVTTLVGGIQSSQTDIASKIADISASVSGQHQGGIPGYAGGAATASWKGQGQEFPQTAPSPSGAGEVRISGSRASRLGPLKSLVKMLFSVVALGAVGAGIAVFLVKQGFLPPSVLVQMKKIAASLTAGRYPAPEAPAPAAQTPAQETPPAQQAPPPDPKIIAAIRAYEVKPGVPLESAVKAASPEADMSAVDWQAEQAAPDRYIITVRVPPAAPNGWPVTYRFDYDAQRNAFTPINTEAQNLSAAEKPADKTPPKKAASAPKPKAKSKRKLPVMAEPSDSEGDEEPPKEDFESAPARKRKMITPMQLPAFKDSQNKNQDADGE
ncbi:MAG: hypothetical protein WC421_00035 [Elusimicrobiales bacterium]